MYTGNVFVMNLTTLGTPSWLTTATYFLLGSLLTLSFKNPPLWGSFNVNDLLLIISFVCFLIAVQKKQIVVTIHKKIIYGFLIALASLILGTLISFIFFHAYAKVALNEYARIIADLIICCEVYCIGVHDTTFVKKAVIAIIAPSLVIGILIYSPPSLLAFALNQSSRFSGFLVDPNYYASFQILSSILLLWVMSQYQSGKNILIAFIAFILFTCSVASVIWSGSRGGIFGLAVGILVLIAFMFWKQSFKKAFVCAFIIIIGCTVSLFIIPNKGRHEIASRAKVIQTPTTETSRLSVIPFTGRQDRVNIWQSSLRTIAKNPFGYGPGYYQVTDIGGNSNDHHRLAHNTLLEIILMGGFELLVVISIGLYVLGKRIVLSSLPIGELHYLSAALIGILGSSLFLDSLPLRWIWVTIGLLLAFVHNPSQGQLN